MATTAGYVYGERSEPGRTATAFENDSKRERWQEREHNRASGLCHTYQHPAYEMGPGQPLFGLDASTRRFEEPFGLHEGKKTMVAGDVRVGTRQSFFDWRIHDKLVSSGSSGVVVLRGDWTTRGGFGVAERRLVLHSFRRKPPVYKQTLCQKEGKLSVPFRSHFSFSLVSERVVHQFGQASRVQRQLVRRLFEAVRKARRSSKRSTSSVFPQNPLSS